MIVKKKPDSTLLRQKAEEKLANEPQISDINVLEMDILKLKYELQVYLIELDMQNNELAMQHEENEKRMTSLLIVNKELATQNEENEKLAEKLILDNKEYAAQNGEKVKRVEELIKLTDKLEHLNSFLLDREIKMIELKKEINDLLELGGFKKKYII